ncbi:M20 family metallopeptidase [Mesorhizobium sp. ArgA1]
MSTFAKPLLSNEERHAVIELRHAMHREPELSNHEWKTQARIRQALEVFGLTNAKPFHETGLYIDIQGLAFGSSRSVALRGDIDALPIQEQRDDLSYQSVLPGRMHACGHDMHTSIAFGTALALHRTREEFSGRVRVFFQPAEEMEPVGGLTVLKEKLLDGFDAAVGLHILPSIPSGVYGARLGAATKSADQFDVVFNGLMAHGAMPYEGVDAIAIAAAFINEVQKVVSREFPSEDGAVVTIGTIRGGEARNIICPSVLLTGTIRTASLVRRDDLVRRVREVAQGIAATHRGEVAFTSHLGDPPVINDAGMVALFRDLVVETVGKTKFVEPPPLSGSDDFGYYSSCVPSIYFWFGSQEPGNETGLHTPTFGASDDLLVPTTELAIRYCRLLLSQ